MQVELFCLLLCESSCCELRQVRRQTVVLWKLGNKCWTKLTVLGCDSLHSGTQVLTLLFWIRNLTRHSDLFQYAGMSVLSGRVLLLLMMSFCFLGVRVSRYTMSRCSSCSSCPCMGCWECSSLVSWRTTVSWTAQTQSKYGATVCSCTHRNWFLVILYPEVGQVGRAEQVPLGFSAGCLRIAAES